MKFYTPLFFVLVASLTSCGIQKRTLMDGFYVPQLAEKQIFDSDQKDAPHELTFAQEAYASPQFWEETEVLFVAEEFTSDEPSEQTTEAISEFEMAEVYFTADAGYEDDEAKIGLNATYEEQEPHESTQDHHVAVESAIVLHENHKQKETAFHRFSKAIHNTVFASEPSSNRTDGLSIAAMCCGIFGLLVFGFGILGVVFGAIGIGKTSREGTRGKGMAITGLVTGLLKILLIIALL